MSVKYGYKPTESKDIINITAQNHKGQLLTPCSKLEYHCDQKGNFHHIQEHTYSLNRQIDQEHP